MLIFNIAIIFLLSLNANSEPQSAETCSVPGTSQGVEALAHATSRCLCEMQKSTITNVAKINELANLDPRNQRTFTEPTKRTAYSVTYKIPEQKLLPGQAIYFGIPPDLATRPVRFAVLGHRQNPEEDRGWNEDRTRDSQPGLTSVQFHSTQAGNNHWRYWGGPSSGEMGAKFAESRYEPELENLYDWRKYGHYGVESRSQSKENLTVDGARMINLGTDPVLISEFTLKVMPPKFDRSIVHSFSPGTELGDLETGIGQVLGGGQKFRGKFPGALILPGDSEVSNSLPAGWKLKDGKLHIPLPIGARLNGIEVAIGDTYPDEVRNKDGGWGSLGGAKAIVVLRKSDNSQDTILNSENVPPEGVLMGTPEDACYVTQAGDEIVVSVHSDTAYIMGIRIGMRD